MNFLRCRVEAEEDRVVLIGYGFRLRIGARLVPDAARGRGDVVLGVRPHDLRLATSEESADLVGVVELVEPRGSDVVARMRLERSGPDGAGLDVVPATDPAGVDVVRAPDGAALDVVLAPDQPVREGDRLGFLVPPERLHFFDPATERRLG
jgi:ABC-type sugar transport system ATPase subunit